MQPAACEITDKLHDVVNELSNTIDLQSTLIRAEMLFRRFRRTVEAVDRKASFPAPSVRQRKPEPQAQAQAQAGSKTNGKSAATASPSAVDVGKTRAEGNDGEDAVSATATISPELRHLLSRKVDVLEKAQIVAHGGGIN